MTKRFDRKGEMGEKLHMQSLCALAHMDFNSPREHSYEDAFNVMKQLKLPRTDFIQLYRRMVFNEYAKNYDDHTKNIAFLMDKRGVWRLSPAYDITFSYRADSIWVNAHQMLINGKAEDITEEDLLNTASTVGIKLTEAKKYMQQIEDTVMRWEFFAKEAGVSEANTKQIKRFLRLE